MDGARVARLAIDDKLVIVDQGMHMLVIADVAAALAGIGPAPVSVPLGDGDYNTPMPTDHAIVVLDRKTSQVLTFDTGGKPKTKAALPQDTGDPCMSRGSDGRVYVDGRTGKPVDDG